MGLENKVSRLPSRTIPDKGSWALRGSIKKEKGTNLKEADSTDGPLNARRKTPAKETTEKSRGGEGKGRCSSSRVEGAAGRYVRERRKRIASLGDKDSK